MKKIDGSPKNLKQLLQNTKYSIHYYQREYMWQRKHIEELIDDLTSEFLEYYDPSHQRMHVADYGAYFMGSVVLAGRENAIIDGQQRFTSMTLLLMYLNNRLHAAGKKYDVVEAMIFSEAFGSKSFNINVPERDDCMNAIYNGKQYDAVDISESVANLQARYNDIVEIFPAEEIGDDALLYFCDWLIEKVFFIEIVATTEQDAHKVFVTMNDRGLSLTSTEMLKGYLLSEIKSDDVREKMNDLWKSKVLELKRDDEKGDEYFIKVWLRAQYAETIRETKAGAVNKDFDLIGGAFHKWVRDEREKIGLDCSDDYEAFIRHFAKYADVFLKIKKVETTFDDKLRYIYYNAKVSFTHQPMLLLSAINFDDTEETINTKLNLVSRFIDLLIISRVTNYRSVDYNTIKNYAFNLTKEIRNASVDDLKVKLLDTFSKEKFTVADRMSGFGLNSFTKMYIRHMLARVTSFIEESIGVTPNYCSYIDPKPKNRNPFEIEHILCDHYEWFADSGEYTDAEDFKRWRNNIGGLLLLHKSINASLNDQLYGYKLGKYTSNEGNIYTASLGNNAYQNNPQFNKFIKAHSLKFEPYNKFGKAEIEKRSILFGDLIELVWNDEMFK